MTATETTPARKSHMAFRSLDSQLKKWNTNDMGCSIQDITTFLKIRQTRSRTGKTIPTGYLPGHTHKRFYE